MKNRTNFFFMVTAFIIISLFIGILLCAVTRFTVKGQGQEKIIQITVQEGDTLWSIARRYFPEDSDLRRHIYQIQQWNEIEGGLLQPNQTLKIVLKES